MASPASEMRSLGDKVRIKQSGLPLNMEFIEKYIRFRDTLLTHVPPGWEQIGLEEVPKCCTHPLRASTAPIAALFLVTSGPRKKGATVNSKRKIN